MADRISTDDFAGHVGCRHVLVPRAQNAVRDWFTLARVLSVQSALQTAIPSVTWTPVRVIRALRSAAEDVL